MQTMHRARHIARSQQGQRAQALIECILDQFFFRLAGPMQHEIGHCIFIAGMADAETQPPKIRAQSRDNIF